MEASAGPQRRDGGSLSKGAVKKGRRGREDCQVLEEKKLTVFGAKGTAERGGVKEMPQIPACTTRERVRPDAGRMCLFSAFVHIFMHV